MLRSVLMAVIAVIVSSQIANAQGPTWATPDSPLEARLGGKGFQQQGLVPLQELPKLVQQGAAPIKDAKQDQHQNWWVQVEGTESGDQVEATLTVGLTHRGGHTEDDDQIGPPDVFRGSDDPIAQQLGTDRYRFGAVIYTWVAASKTWVKSEVRLESHVSSQLSLKGAGGGQSTYFVVCLFVETETAPGSQAGVRLCVVQSWGASLTSKKPGGHQGGGNQQGGGKGKG